MSKTLFFAAVVIGATAAAATVTSACAVEVDGEATFECRQIDAAGDAVVIQTTNLTSHEVEVFEDAARSWSEWTGGRIRVDVTGDPRTKLKVIALRDASEFKTFRDNVKTQAVTWNDGSGITFAPERIPDDGVLYAVFAHEIGHVLGLNHSSHEGSLMYSAPDKWRGFELTPVDVEELRVCHFDRI